jgi:hypothetical protein
MIRSVLGVNWTNTDEDVHLVTTHNRQRSTQPLTNQGSG